MNHVGPVGRARGLRLPAAVLAAVLGAAVAGLAGAGPAAAHDALVGTSPAAGAKVGRLPARITLSFAQPAKATGTRVSVRGPGGECADGPPELVDRDVRQALRADCPAGTYTVLWRVASGDGHPVSGRFSFSAAAGGAGAATASPSGSPSPDASASPSPHASVSPSGSPSPDPSASPSGSPSAPSLQPAGASTDTSRDAGVPLLAVVAVAVLLLAGLALGLVVSGVVPRPGRRRT